ncbi:SIR2 family protein [Novosphingobium sp.]|uniref:SIR2 family protein n=1 Tax=Novosphingobium sp. TaxID=1874826 RepID=UPI003BAC4FDE
MDLEEALRRVYLGRSIAFMGAGFSAGIAAIEGSVPYGFEFAAELGGAAGETDHLSLDLAASIYEQNKCVPSLRELIQKRFTVKSQSDPQTVIACLPWRRIYTTNYDNSIEFGRASRGLNYSVATSSDRPVHHAHEFTVVHLHGYVDRLSTEDWEEEYVLTNEQYASDKLRESGWIEMFRNDVEYADSLIFFGYGVGDIDVARLLFSNPSLKDKTFFLIGKGAPRSVEIRASAFGSTHRLDTDEVCAMIPPADRIDVPKASPFLAALRDVCLVPSPEKPSRKDVVDLLIKGDCNPDFISRDLVNGTTDYYVSRDEISAKLAEPNKGALRWFVHGGVGGREVHLSERDCALIFVAGTSGPAIGRRS